MSTNFDNLFSLARFKLFDYVHLHIHIQTNVRTKVKVRLRVWFLHKHSLKGNTRHTYVFCSGKYDQLDVKKNMSCRGSYCRQVLHQYELLYGGYFWKWYLYSSYGQLWTDPNKIWLVDVNCKKIFFTQFFLHTFITRQFVGIFSSFFVLIMIKTYEPSLIKLYSK